MRLCLPGAGAGAGAGGGRTGARKALAVLAEDCRQLAASPTCMLTILAFSIYNGAIGCYSFYGRAARHAVALFSLRLPCCDVCAGNPVPTPLLTSACCCALPRLPACLPAGPKAARDIFKLPAERADLMFGAVTGRSACAGLWLAWPGGSMGPRGLVCLPAVLLPKGCLPASAFGPSWEADSSRGTHQCATALFSVLCAVGTGVLGTLSGGLALDWLGPSVRNALLLCTGEEEVAGSGGCQLVAG